MGRIIAVPIFIFLMILNVRSVLGHVNGLLPLNTVKTAGFIHDLLLVCFYGLIIILYFLRRPPRSISTSFVTNTIAILAAIIPFIFPFMGESGLINPRMIVIADLTIMAGMVLCIYSLCSLGRSFSIIPQARKLVQDGPYRLIRHPLYLGELVSTFGIVLVDARILKVSLYGLFIGFQIYRAFQEERLLGTVFPEYQEYYTRTARLVPGLF